MPNRAEYSLIPGGARLTPEIVVFVCAECLKPQLDLMLRSSEVIAVQRSTDEMDCETDVELLASALDVELAQILGSPNFRTYR